MTAAGQGLVVGSANARVGLPAAIEVLRGGGSAIDAVVAAVRLVEADVGDSSVGRGGLPNILGEVELDASIMDGRGLRAGAVGALTGHEAAIEVARGVMEHLPHAFVAGPGGARLADEIGVPRADLLTDESRRVWRSRLDRASASPATAADVRRLVGSLSRDPELPEPPHGTVNVIARDAGGTIASAVSTSGWAWKYPGRLGDSPVIGAGNYCDDRYGAAACTGRGEMTFRCCTAHTVVMLLRFGRPLDEALRTALEDLDHLDDPWASEVNIVGIDAAGNHCAVSTAEGKTYVWQRTDMEAMAEPARAVVPLALVGRASMDEVPS